MNIPDRKQALELFKKYNQSESLYKHALSVEAVMRYMARKAGEDEETKVLPTDRRINCGPSVAAAWAIRTSTRNYLSQRYFFRSSPTPWFTKSSV